MSVFSNIYNLRHLMAATLLLPLLCACVADNDICEDITKPQIANSNQFINLSIVVSSGNESITRANPAGGEDGDGREAGTDLENIVNGITLILYKINNGEGLNDLTDKDTIDFIQYYGVDLVDDYEYENEDCKKEAVYTTGDQPLEGLDLAKTYRAIVVANVDLTKEDFTVGKNVKEVLDHTSKVSPQLIFQNSNLGATATDFVMSLESEENTLVKFQDPETTTSANGQIIEKYKFDGIHIERLAARIDFWAKGVSYDEDLEGYKYSVYDNNGESNDYFVLTAVMPFNLYDGDEFLFKRIGDSSAKNYLASENNMEDNVVIDPNTFKKADVPPTKDGVVSIPDYMNSSYWLDNIIDKDIDKELKDLPHMTMSGVQDNKQWGKAKSEYKEGTITGDNIIVGYAKENTLPINSPLFYYATGLRIEGDYYKYNDGEETKEHLVYYGFLRHKGEGYAQGDTYYPMWSKEDLKKYKEGTLEDKQQKLLNGSPMNFGVVRNNIYRISIDKIKKRGEEQPEITWKIMVKNWDVFEHKTIFM